MTMLKFRSKGFTRMIQHMLKNERKIPYVDETTDEYGLWLVKDDGIYVMSPTLKRDLVIDPIDRKKKCHVIYAKGYETHAANLWEKTHAVSGDDFAEFIPLSEQQMKRVALSGELDIRLTETEISVYA